MIEDIAYLSVKWLPLTAYSNRSILTVPTQKNDDLY